MPQSPSYRAGSLPALGRGVVTKGSTMTSKRYSIVKAHAAGLDYDTKWVIQDHANNKAYVTYTHEGSTHVVAYQDWKLSYKYSETLNQQAREEDARAKAALKAAEDAKAAEVVQAASVQQEVGASSEESQVGASGDQQVEGTSGEEQAPAEVEEPKVEVKAPAKPRQRRAAKVAA
jgi:hypothetical protein